jgi:hypothetical protein
VKLECFLSCLNFLLLITFAVMDNSDSHMETINEETDDDDDMVMLDGPPANTTKVGSSSVWKFFTKIGIVDGGEKCKCDGCGAKYSCGASTSHLKRHLKKCNKTLKNHDVGELLDDNAKFLKRWKFDPMAYRDSLSRSIIKHDLPFSYAEYDGVNETNKVLNPDFVSISRNTAKSDCMSVFSIEKEKLKRELASIPGRICLTSDVWTAVTTQGYMTITAHYVDKGWKLNSRLLSFCHLDSAHTGLELSGKVLGALKDWGIDGKIFSLTLDNASNNDRMVTILKERLNLQDALLCNGDYFHVRCCAHVLNIIVQAGLAVAGDALYKI